MPRHPVVKKLTNHEKALKRALRREREFGSLREHVKYLSGKYPALLEEIIIKHEMVAKKYTEAAKELEEFYQSVVNPVVDEIADQISVVNEKLEREFGSAPYEEMKIIGNPITKIGAGTPVAVFYWKHQHTMSKPWDLPTPQHLIDTLNSQSATIGRVLGLAQSVIQEEARLVAASEKEAT